MTSTDYTHLFMVLSKNLEEFIDEVKKKKSSFMATDEWTVKEVLCHIVFWHENYAANYKALADGKEPPLYDAPGYQLNYDGVTLFNRHSVPTLIRRAQKAQSILKIAILESRIPQMTYKKNGRTYKTEEFLDMVARHIHTHTLQIRRAK